MIGHILSVYFGSGDDTKNSSPEWLHGCLLWAIHILHSDHLLPSPADSTQWNTDLQARIKHRLSPPLTSKHNFVKSSTFKRRTRFFLRFPVEILAWHRRFPVFYISSKVNKARRQEQKCDCITQPHKIGFFFLMKSYKCSLFFLFDSLISNKSFAAGAASILRKVSESWFVYKPHKICDVLCRSAKLHSNNRLKQIFIRGLP